jgi:ubiquinone biosynthesis monooxygenase Coq7
MTSFRRRAGQAALPRVGDLEGWLRNDLRSDHAGETGAVFIYRGILAVSGDPDVRRFARAHLATEEEHLGFFEHWLEPADHSVLIPLWRLSGWLLGALAAAGGARLVFLTIDAVETFVVEHYAHQINRLREEDLWPDVRLVLETFRHDEDHHRLDALSRAGERPNNLLENAWRGIVDTGSRLAVVAARLV